jgi:hypothetical protein
LKEAVKLGKRIAWLTGCEFLQTNRLRALLARSPLSAPLEGDVPQEFGPNPLDERA